MATQLKNSLSIPSIPAGGSVVVPHGLNWNDVPKRPDIIFLPAQGIGVVADTINVTITNEGDGPSPACNVLVESWHTVERAFGPASALALAPQPYVVRSTPEFGQGSTFCFVYRPGDTTPGGNVFTDWATLVQVMQLTPGYKLLMFDDAIVSPIQIPVGTWAMKDVIWTGVLRNTGVASFNTIVEVLEGTVFTNLRYFGGPITVRNLATTISPVSDIVGGEGDALAIGFGVPGAGEIPVFQNLGTVAFFDLSNIGAGESAGCFTFAELGGGGVPGGPSTFPLFYNGGPGNFFLGVGVNLDDDMIAGLAGSGHSYTLLRVFGTSDIGQQTLVGANIDRSLYSMLRSSYGLNPMTPAVPAVAPVVALHNEVLRFNTTAGDIAQPLPDIVGQASFLSPDLHIDSRGMTVIVKNLIGANAVNVSPAAGQTIDGGAGPVVVAAGTAAMFVSDGVSDWIQVV